MYVCMFDMFDIFVILAHHHGWIQGPATVGQLPVYDEEGKKLLCIVYVCTVSAVCRCVFGNMFMYVCMVHTKPLCNDSPVYIQCMV